MFNTFAHINECGREGWKTFPALCAMSEHLTLWGPSGVELEKANRLRITSLGPKDVLDAVNAGKIRIAARESWLQGKSWRLKESADGDEFSRAWLPYFDDEIHRLIGSPNIVVMPEEKGMTWAREQAEIRSDRYKAALRLVRSGCIPNGTRDRIKRLDGTKKHRETEAAKLILRDSKNHYDAKVALGANICLDAAALPLWDFLALADDAPTRLPAASKAIYSHERIQALFELLIELTEAPSSKAVMVLLESNKVKEELSDLICYESTVRQKLRLMVKKGWKTDHTILDVLGFERTPFVAPFLAAGGILTAIVGAFCSTADLAKSARRKTSRRDFLKRAAAAGGGAVGLASAAYAPGLYLLRQDDRISLGQDYEGPITPSLLMHGIDNPGYSQAMQILAALDEKVTSRTSAKRKDRSSPSE